MPNGSSFPPSPAHSLSNVAAALEALQKAFRPTDEAPKQEQAATDDIPQQPAHDPLVQS